MSKTDAAYMRAYRRRKKLEAASAAIGGHTTYDLDLAHDRIAELEEENASLDRAGSAMTKEIDRLMQEVHHLKEELAKRPEPLIQENSDGSRTLGWAEPSFGHSRPAPKPGKGK